MPDLAIQAGVGLIYLLFVGLTFSAFMVARIIRMRSDPKLQAGLLSPLGSLYTLTTAFLLSNVIFQFTNLRTAIIQEVVTINKLAAVLTVLPGEQRVEGRRLLFDYGESIVSHEALTMRSGQRSEQTQLAIDRLRDFLASADAAPSPTLPQTPESVNYFRKASDFGFDLIDSRERRLSLARQTFPMRLWLAIGIMYLALALLAFLVHGNGWTSTWVAVILLLSAPVPPMLLFIYSNPIVHGLVDISATVRAVLERSLA